MVKHECKPASKKERKKESKWLKKQGENMFKGKSNWKSEKAEKERKLKV